MVHIDLLNNTLLTIFDALLVTKWPIFKAFGTLKGPKKAQNGP